MNRKTIMRGICSLLIVCMVLTSGAYAAPVVTKDESVYVILNSDGTVDETIVSSWLHGEKGLEVKDSTILDEIENIKGDEVPTKDGENLIWKLEDEDLFYQGTTDKKLPLEVKVTYFLDDKEISPKEIGGKSGRIKIRLEVKNKDGHSKIINGKRRTIYTPFMVAAIMNLSDDHFKDVQVNRGEVISDGKNQVVTFITIPGLKDSFDIDSDILDIDLDEVLEVTANVDNFDMGPIMITATTDIPALDDIEEADSLDELEDGLEELKDAVQQLCDGTDTLADNMELFYENFEKLGNGAKALGDGASALNQGLGKAQSGALELKDGIGALGKGATVLGNRSVDYAKGASKFASGAKLFADEVTKTLTDKVGELSAGTQAIAYGAEGLADGAGALSDGATKLSDGLEEMAEGTGKLSYGQKQVIGGIEKSISGVQALKDGRTKENETMKEAIGDMMQILAVFEQITSNEEVKAIIASDEALRNAMLSAKGNIECLRQLQSALEASEGNDQIFDVDGLDGLEDGLEGLKKEAEGVSVGIDEIHQVLTDEEKGAIVGAKGLADGANKLSAGAGELQSGAEELEAEVSSGIRTATSKLGEVGKFARGANDLDIASKKLSDGANKIGAGGEEATKGADALASGLGELQNGGNQLEDGALALVDGASQLGEGAGKLAEGSNELRDGMHKFNEEGIERIDDELSDKTDDIETILDVKDELVELSKDYKTFAGAGEDMDCSMKFIMKTEEIEGNGEEVIELEEPEEEKKGFIEWLKSWFKK